MDSNREIMKMQGWLEIRRLSKNPRRREISTRPQSLPIGKREGPGYEDEGEILVADFTLTANFKMAAKENTFQAPMK